MLSRSDQQNLPVNPPHGGHTHKVFVLLLFNFMLLTFICLIEVIGGSIYNSCNLKSALNLYIYFSTYSHNRDSTKLFFILFCNLGNECKG